jgi:anaerobic magnesium-protoporphyrin IX monomethyl ester cyclase
MTARATIVLYYARLADSETGPPSGKDVLPLSVLTIAAWPHRDGHDVVILDGNLFETEAEAHAAVVDACDGATIFGTTAILGHQVSDGFRCTRAVRARYPKIHTIAGGWFPSVEPELYLSTGLWDAVCLGQGEITFREYVDAVVSGADLGGVAGLAIRREGAVHYTDHRQVVGWDKLLNCPWDLLDFEPYRRAQLEQRGGRLVERLPRPNGFKENRGHVGIAYYASYGCPEPCTFCCSPEVTGQRWKAMPAQRILDDLEELTDRWDFDVVRFHDANWGVAHKRVREFCEGKLERDLDFFWFSMLQASSVMRYEERTVDLMAESGCYVVNIGAETGSERTMLELIGKHTAGDENFDAALEMDKRGIVTWMTYIIGYPGEERSSMLQTIDQARRIRAACPTAHPAVWTYQPIPGTPLYRQAVEDGFVPPTTHEDWGNFGEYHLEATWDAPVPEDVHVRRRLFQHYASLSHGLTRGQIGFWERRAQQRLQAGNWRFARAEAKAFDLVDRFSRRVLGKARPSPEWMKGDGVPVSTGS